MLILGSKVYGSVTLNPKPYTFVAGVRVLQVGSGAFGLGPLAFRVRCLVALAALGVQDHGLGFRVKVWGLGKMGFRA